MGSLLSGQPSGAELQSKQLLLQSIDTSKVDSEDCNDMKHGALPSDYPLQLANQRSEQSPDQLCDFKSQTIASTGKNPGISAKPSLVINSQL